ncbi:hypothetical protein GW17_00025905 [Ensete ventricosum]|nr:hypothetical protein GW17_00025905 [Ensete ventricosum]
MPLLWRGEHTQLCPLGPRWWHWGRSGSGVDGGAWRRGASLFTIAMNGRWRIPIREHIAMGEASLSPSRQGPRNRISSVAHS